MATVAKKTHYELMIILKDSLSEKATKEALEVIRGHISDAKGTITFEDLWGTKSFVYPIKDTAQGYYAIFYFDLAKEQVAELKKELDLEQTILRKLMISLPATMNVKEFIEEEKKRTQAEDERLEAEREKKKTEQAAKKTPSRAPKADEATEGTVEVKPESEA